MPPIAVYGTGTIGACLATLTTGNGYPTVLIGHSPDGLNRCRKVMEQNWDDLVMEGLATPANKAAAMSLAQITNDPAALSGSAIVFEAVAEDLSIQEAVYAQITKTCGTEVIVASTTSSIDAGLLATHIENPARFLIAHPFQPAHMLPLVEVVRHEGTSERTVQTSCALPENRNRQVILLKKSVPGSMTPLALRWSRPSP